MDDMTLNLFLLFFKTEGARAVQAVKSLFSPYHRKKDATPPKQVSKSVDDIREVEKILYSDLVSS